MLFYNRTLKGGGGDSPNQGSPIFPAGILRVPQLPPPLGHSLKNPTILEFLDYTQNPTLMGLEPSILREVLGF